MFDSSTTYTEWHQNIGASLLGFLKNNLGWILSINIDPEQCVPWTSIIANQGQCNRNLRLFIVFTIKILMLHV